MNSNRIDSLVWPLAAPVTWCAHWIAPIGASGLTNVAFRARKQIDLSEVPSSMVLHVAAESTYRLYINGVDVGRGPVRGTRTVNFFDSYEIAPFLRPEENWIAVSVHSPNIPTFIAAPAQPGLLLQLDDGFVVTDDSWRVQPAPDWRSDVSLYTFQIGHMEWHDLRQEPCGWTTGEDAGQWDPPAIISPNERLDGKALHERDIPPLCEQLHLPVSVSAGAETPPLNDINDTAVAQRMTEETHAPGPAQSNLTSLSQASGSPVVIEPPSDGGGVAVIFDFRHVINGGFEIDLDVPAGTILDVGYEEQLINGRLQFVHGPYLFADRYILCEGRQRVGNAFATRGFQMLQIVLRQFDRPIQMHRVTGIDRRYPYVDRGTFTCSDPLLNDIWSRSVETLKACTIDTIVDCPWRENTLYLNDMLVEQVTSLQAFGDPRIAARCWRLALSQPAEGGLLPCAIPGGPVPGLDAAASIDRMTFPATQLWLAGMLEEYLLYTGDRRLVEEAIEPLLAILDTFAQWENDEGLLEPPAKYWNFIDWAFPESFQDGHQTATLDWLHVGALNATARLLERMGDKRDRSPLTDKAARLGETIDKRFWNADRACYMDRADDDPATGSASQVTHAIALLSGRACGARTPELAAALQRDDLLVPELYLHHLVLRAMVATDQSDAALERIRRYWGPIVLSGSPTIWECGVQQHGKSAFNWAGSLCHGFSTTPIDFFQTVILGVRPTDAGFGRCRIAPRCFDLAHARGSVPTPMGNLDIAWQRQGDRLALELNIPRGIVAELRTGEEIGEGPHTLEVAT